MVTRAYVLIESVPGRNKDIHGTLHRLPQVKLIDRVTGPYDLVAVIEASDLTSVANFVSDRVHTISGVVRTLTCLAVPETSD
ncbi:MAG: Lrp/AsnC ligand binding domain-containing protein [Chloroflexi bacterium]|nr:Lrp/AsnC ligand binding domain-containing protein [Chloroflexota bacterium]